ncbi:MAG: DUF6544 family protein [Acidimicrobiia bacterium]
MTIAAIGVVLTVLTESMVADLPDPAHRAINRSGVVGMHIPDTVHVRQNGRIRSDRSGRWLRFTAAEQYTLDPPSFRWEAALRVAGVGVGRAIDSLDHGRGRMHVRVLGLFTAVDATGPEMDQGSVMRWLNETMWFPAVWATDTIKWEPIDRHRARATVAVAGLEATAVFHFDEHGRLVNFTADRYRDDHGVFAMTPWSTPLSDHRRFNGVELPAAGSALWTLDDGDFEYIQIDVSSIRYSNSTAG